MDIGVDMHLQYRIGITPYFVEFMSCVESKRSQLLENLRCDNMLWYHKDPRTQKDNICLFFTPIRNKMQPS